MLKRQKGLQVADDLKRNGVVIDVGLDCVSNPLLPGDANQDRDNISDAGSLQHIHTRSPSVASMGGTLRRGRKLSFRPALTPSTNAEDLVNINISGKIFTTTWATLWRHPESRLGQLGKNDKNYNPEKNEFYFGRHTGIFKQILFFHQTGDLHLPRNICPIMIGRELEYWKVPDAAISHCCYTEYIVMRHQKNALKIFEEAFKDRGLPEGFEDMSRWDRLRSRMWCALNNSTSTTPAKVIAGISVIFILLSISVLCLETHPLFRPGGTGNNAALHYHRVSFHPEEAAHDTPEEAIHGEDSSPIEELEELEHHVEVEMKLHASNKTSRRNNLTTAMPILALQNASESGSAVFDSRILLFIDYMCIAYFTIEFVVKLIIAPKMLSFLTDYYTFIDIIALTPVYIELCVAFITPLENYRETIFELMAFMQIARLFRLFHLMRRYESLRIFVYTVQSSLKEILLLMLFLAISVILYSTLIFYADDREVFISIPHCFWWSVVTLTTIGYGDVVPKFATGYLVGAACAITGVLLISFTVPIIVNNFLLYYSYLQATRSNEMKVQIQQHTLYAEEREKQRAKYHRKSFAINLKRKKFNFRTLSHSLTFGHGRKTPPTPKAPRKSIEKEQTSFFKRRKKTKRTYVGTRLAVRSETSGTASEHQKLDNGGSITGPKRYTVDEFCETYQNRRSKSPCLFVFEDSNAEVSQVIDL